MYANAGEVFTTTDGGRRWRQAYSRCADGTGKKGKRWASIGLEDTSCWRVAFDPADPERRYICYTDIGLAKSEDGGRAWRSATAGMPWQNTVYDLAFDPRDSRTLYAACSDQHDIPHWMSAQGPRAPGGICVSRDGGASWKASSQGLPSAPATAVVVGAFPAGARPALFAGVYGHGVYRSDDGAATWASKSEGLDPAGNRQVCSIRRRQDGALLCVVAARRAGGEGEAPLSGGVFLSTDRGERWKKISPPEMFRPVDVACHPEKPDILYVAAMDGMGHDGGVYKTVDGGGQWQRLSIPFDRRICAYQEGFSVALNPRRPEIVYYLTITHGMFISFDAGASWRAAAAGASPPFLSCQRIQWDPLDGKTVYVSTFGGGVWRGPDPAGEPVAR
jgi:photosystem II stability/assembly factor-like uncharacterized protein